MQKYNIEDFSDNGKKTDIGVRNLETSLDHLLSTCTDFVEDESLLQMTLRKLGAVCVHSPKYHCEMAGEGIEYSWGNAKMK